MIYQFQAHVIITGTIECLTGLHIGGPEENYEIGGMDNPIIKDPITKMPYIPGSSLKGKMRSMTEWTTEGCLHSDGKVHTCIRPNCPVCRIFGTSAAENQNLKAGKTPLGPTRLLVRDAQFSCQKTPNSQKYVENEIFQTEIKTENSINRITSEANPRPMERIPKGTKFDFEMVYGIYDLGYDKNHDDIAYFPKVAAAMDMVEQTFLGGGGSRGSGKIKFGIENIIIKRLEDYQTLQTGKPIEFVPQKEEPIDALFQRVQQDLRTLFPGTNAMEETVPPETPTPVV